MTHDFFHISFVGYVDNTTCHNYFPVLSSFMTYNRVCNQSNTTNAISGTVTAYSSRERESNPVFSGFRVVRPLVFCVMFCRSSFVLVFLLAIVLFVLLFTDSDYPIASANSSNSKVTHFLITLRSQEVSYGLNSNVKQNKNNI